jgi:ankyrin repeat protein
MPILELLADVEEVDPNLADNDGNTPLIFAAQAGNVTTLLGILNIVKAQDLQKTTAD